MNINTTRFGSLPVEPDDVVRFADGLLGLPACRDWILLADAESDALAWMQSVDRPEVAFAVVSPRRFVPQYQIRVARRELEPLEFSSLSEAQVLVILGRSEHGVTLNLKAPLVLNLAKRTGRQVITNGELPVQYELGAAPPALRKSA
jgi:flagellar assembly factor FliW